MKRRRGFDTAVNGIVATTLPPTSTVSVMSFFRWLCVFAVSVAVCLPVIDAADRWTGGGREWTRSVAVVAFVAPSSAIVAGNVVLPTGTMSTPSVAFAPLIFTPMAIANLPLPVRLLFAFAFRFRRHVDLLPRRRADDLDPLLADDAVERQRHVVRRGGETEDAWAVQRADRLDPPVIRLADVDARAQRDGHVQARFDPAHDQEPCVRNDSGADFSLLEVDQADRLGLRRFQKKFAHTWRSDGTAKFPTLSIGVGCRAHGARRPHRLARRRSLRRLQLAHRAAAFPPAPAAKGHRHRAADRRQRHVALPAVAARAQRRDAADPCDARAAVVRVALLRDRLLGGDRRDLRRLAAVRAARRLRPLRAAPVARLPLDHARRARRRRLGRARAAARRARADRDRCAAARGRGDAHRRHRRPACGAVLAAVAAAHHLRDGARAASRPRLPRGRPRRPRSDLRAEAPRGRRRARPGRPRDRRPRQSRDVRRPGRDDRAPARQPRAAPRQRRRGHARPLARRHLRLRRADARAETELRRGAGRARRATAARPRAPAARVSRRRRAGDSAHALRALARRAVRLPPAALVAGRALHPVPHGPLPPRRVAAVRAHRRRLLAAAVAPRHHAGDRADRTASSAALSVAPHAASIFSDARASPRVGPTLTMAGGATCSIATATLRGGTASPKKTTAGLSTPPQRSQGGTTKVSSS